MSRAQSDNHPQISGKSGYALSSEIDLFWGVSNYFLSDDIMPLWIGYLVKS